MKVSSYRERDYDFGQLMLTVRTKLKLTQTALADLLGVQRRTVIDWQAAHQKVLLDEAWLAELQSRAAASQVSTSREESGVTTRSPVSPASSGRRIDWGDAPAVTSFYGRAWERDLLAQWVIEERCRVVSVLGQGGIGKSALATQVMHSVAQDFEVVIWRSLRDIPSCEALLESCLQVLAPQALSDASASLESRQNLLLDCLRSRRVLLVYDNLESFLQEGEESGRMRTGYEGFARVLRRVAETEHQSCWLLTSREKPVDLVPFEGDRAPVRTLRLAQLVAEACQQLLTEKGVAGSTSEQLRLIEAYAGNPLALKIVAQTIVDLLDGQISPFLEQGEVIFGGVRALLDEQYARLSATEQSVLFWLAILREPVSLKALQAALMVPLSRAQMLEAVDSLHRRSLVERGQRPGSFTLQSVVLEYATDRLVSTASQELVQGRLRLLHEHGISQAQAKDYVREIQQRLLVHPLRERLHAELGANAQVEAHLLPLLSQFRTEDAASQGYGPANVITLLTALRGHLRGLDLSRLALRGVYLQGVEMQDANLSFAQLRECLLTQSFDALTTLATSHSGKFWATAGRRGQVHVWRERGNQLHLSWQAHSAAVYALAFSPDERLLASASFDGSLKLWEVEGGGLLWSDWQTRATIESLAFSPDGCLLASGGLDGNVRLWDPKLGTLLEELPHPGLVFALAWSPDGQWLSSGDSTGTIRLWQRQPTAMAHCIQTLSGQSSWVRGLAFAPDGGILASASHDGSLKLWELSSGRCLQTLSRQAEKGHTAFVHRVAWSPNGETLASSGSDRTIWLWDAHRGTCRAVLHGHSADVRGLAFTPDSSQLLSSSEDGTLRLWDVEHAQCMHVLQGYPASFYDLDWSPDGTELASVGTERVVSLWQVGGLAGGRPRSMLRGHEWSVHGVAWHPDGGVLASSGLDNAIRLWERASGRSLEVIRDRDHLDTWFWGVAWSPDGKRLAGTTYGRGVLVWEMRARSGHWIGRELATWIRRVAWSPDGTRLVAGAGDGHLYVWDAQDGRLLQRLAGHQGVIMSVAFSPDGTQLASGGGGWGKGELFVWDAQTGARLSSWHEPSEVVYALAWSPIGGGIISGGSDGRLGWWDLHHGERVRVHKAHEGAVQALKVSPDSRTLASGGDDGAIMLWDLHSGQHLQTLRRDRPYERLTITGIRGLSEAQKASLRALGALEDEADQQSSRPEQAAEL
jgi:WD40 repeat protein